MIELNKVYCNDCFDIISQIDDNSIDLICIDPPYGISYNNEDWDSEKEFDWCRLFEEYKRIIKDTGDIIIFQGWSNVCETKLVGEKYFTLKNWIIYDRIKGRGAKTNMVSTREDILWFIVKDKGYTYNKIFSNIPKKTKGMGEKNGQANRALSNVWTDLSPIVPWSKERFDEKNHYNI